MAEKTIYRIIDLATNEPVGVYSRAYRDEYDFGSPDAALSANVHGVHRDATKYRIAKIKVTEEEIPT